MIRPKLVALASAGILVVAGSAACGGRDSPAEASVPTATPVVTNAPDPFGHWYTWDEIQDLGLPGPPRITLQEAHSRDDAAMHVGCHVVGILRVFELYVTHARTSRGAPGEELPKSVTYTIDGGVPVTGRWEATAYDLAYDGAFAPYAERDAILRGFTEGTSEFVVTIAGDRTSPAYTFQPAGYDAAVKPVLEICK